MCINRITRFSCIDSRSYCGQSLFCYLLSIHTNQNKIYYYNSNTNINNNIVPYCIIISSSILKTCFLCTTCIAMFKYALTCSLSIWSMTFHKNETFMKWKEPKPWSKSIYCWNKSRRETLIKTSFRVNNDLNVNEEASNRYSKERWDLHIHKATLQSLRQECHRSVL